MQNDNFPAGEQAVAPSGKPIPYGYWQLTRTATYSYLFVLPLMALYEIGIRLVNRGEFGVRVGADVLIKKFFDLVGLRETLYLSMAMTLVGVAILLIERKKMIPIILRYFGAMLAESSLYAIAIGVTIATLLQNVMHGAQLVVGQATTGSGAAQATAAASGGITRNLVLSLGAGFYEELVFRLLLVTLLYFLIRLLFKSKGLAYAVAAVIGSVIFSWVHYIGAYGDVFTWYSFIFRFLMGLAFNALLLKRGFGVAAMTHALYDVFVTLYTG